MLDIRKGLEWLLAEIKSGMPLTEKDHGWTIRNIDALNAALEKKERAFLAKAGFNPSQPRVPAGSADGGQWTDGGGTPQPASQKPRRNIIGELFGIRPAYGGESPRPKPFNVDKSVNYLQQNLSPKQFGEGLCATNVANAVRASGISLGRPPITTSERATKPWARDYGSELEKVNFSKIAASDFSGSYPPVGYMPQKGDIVVIQPIKSQNPAGHIAMYDSAQWISDFKQHRDIWPNLTYQNNGANYDIYRHQNRE